MRIEITFETSQPPTGFVTWTPTQRPEAFVGWLDLLTILAGAVEDEIRGEPGSGRQPDIGADVGCAVFDAGRADCQLRLAGPQVELGPADQ